jgi:hypothetical protein
MLVWMAAEKARPGRVTPFRRYALLGDDIVIADVAVAREYAQLMGRLGVQISDHKSLITDNGSFEFAKQFWTKGGRVNLSPVSARAVLSASTLLGITQLAIKYDMGLVPVMRFAGLGYWSMSRLQSTSRLSRKRLRLMGLTSKPHTIGGVGWLKSSLEYWLGRGCPLSPYSKGWILQHAREVFKVRQLILPPTEYMVDGEWAFSEYTVLRNWMDMWLKYLLWYWKVLFAYDPSIEEIVSPPDLNFKYYRSDVDQFTRYGFIFKVYDWVGDKSPGWCPGALGTGPTDGSSGPESPDMGS